MYLAELKASGDWPFVLDLHPRLTVVAGLGRERSHRLADLINGALCGQLDELEARVEVDGRECPLTAELLARLGIPPDTDITLSAADLPGVRPLEAEGDTSSASDERPRPPADEPPESAELAEARVALFRAREATTGAELALSAARAAVDPEAPKAMVAAEDALEAARRDRDEAAARVRAAQAALDAASADAAARQVDVRADTDRQRLAFAQRRQELLAALTATPTTDPTPVAEALAELRRIEALPPQPVAEAAALADAWVALQQRRATLPPSRSAPTALVEAALETLEAARVDYARAQEGARLAHLSPQNVADIETAHAAVVDAEEKVEGRRMASPMARRRLEAAQAAEQQVLAAMGLPSYHAFLLRTAPGLSTPIEDDRLKRAHAALMDAEAVWEELHAPAPDDEHAQQFAAEANRLRAEAVALLGGEPAGDLDGALRALRRPTADSGPAGRALLAALESVGAITEADGDPAAMAASWLAYADEDHARRAALEAELGGLQSDMDDLASGATDAEQPEERPAVAWAESGMPVQVRTRLEAELDEARAELAAATDLEEVARRARNQASTRLENARSAELRVGSLTEELTGATAAHEQAAARVEQLERTELQRLPIEAAPVAGAGPTAAPEFDISGVDTGALEVYLLARLVAQRSVGQAGTLPLVVDDAFVGLPVETIERAIAVLERFTPTFQFIYLSDDPEIEAWARLFGPKGASVRRFSSARSASTT